MKYAGWNVPVNVYGPDKQGYSGYSTQRRLKGDWATSAYNEMSLNNNSKATAK